MKPSCCCFFVLYLLILLLNSVHGWSDTFDYEEDYWIPVGRLVKKEQRKEILSTEYGTISTVDLDDGIGRMRWVQGMKKHHLQFISLDPNSLFLPSILHADMIFYVHTGSGRLSYTEDGNMKEVRLTRGDVYRLKSGTIFFLQSSLETERQRFRINAIFSNADEELQGNWAGAYSGVHELFRGFDKRLLQAAFQVSEEVIEEIINGSKRALIVHAGDSTEKKDLWEFETSFIKSFLRLGMDIELESNKKKKHEDKDAKTFNVFKEDRDVDNCDGWSTMVTSKDLKALKGSDIGVFMVNLSTNAMMAPHWNPIATEMGVVLEGRGMVRVVCSSNLTRPECKNTRFLVEEGDVFVVPRFHPMAHMSFNNEKLVFMGFSTSNRNNHPQFLVGEASVLRALNKRVIEMAFNVNETTVSRLLDARKGSVILDCVKCAEEEEEMGKREEEEMKRREEEKRRREEEEKRRREEEERRRREEEEERKRKEEEEEERRRQEEEEERKRKEEEEEERREQEEEERKRKEEEEEERRRQEEEERKRQEEEEERRQKEEEEEAKRKEEERQREEERRRQEEEERKREEEEEERRRQEEEEERIRREEEEEKRRQEEEEERRRKEEEEAKRQEEERQREEEEDIRRQEAERKRQEEEERRRQEEEEERIQREEEEEEEAKRKEEERRQREEEEEIRRQEEEEERRRQAKEEERRREEEARRQEEEQEDERRQQEEEERRHQEEEESEEEAAMREEEEREREWEQPGRRRHQGRSEEESTRGEEEQVRPERRIPSEGEQEETEEEATMREEEERQESWEQSEERWRRGREI